MGKMKDIAYYPGFLTYKQQQILGVFDDDFISSELIARRCRLSRKLVSKHLKILSDVHIIRVISFKELLKIYFTTSIEIKHIRNALEEIAIKRDKLQKKLQKYFHMAVYNRQLFYCLTPYGLSLQDYLLVGSSIHISAFGSLVSR